MMDAREAFCGCGERDRKRANEPKEGEGIGQGELRRMGMMGEWMEIGAHMGIGVTLIASSPSNAH
jgi:hypothetical protein